MQLDLVIAKVSHSLLELIQRPITPPLFAQLEFPPHFDVISSCTDHYHMLLKEFLEIMTPNFVKPPTKHGIEYYIISEGPFMPVLTIYRPEKP